MSFQNYDWPSHKELAIGKTGSGKTTLIWRHFIERAARFKFIYDHKAMEFSRRYKIKPCFTKEEMLEVIKTGKGIICFCPSKMFPGDIEAGCEWFCEWVFKICEHIAGVKLLLIDELQNVVGSYTRPKWLLVVCDTGRTFQIDCYFIAAASNAIHNLVRKQISDLYSFASNADIQWETAMCGMNEQAIRDLRKGEYLTRNLDNGSEIVKGGEFFT